MKLRFIAIFPILFILSLVFGNSVKVSQSRERFFSLPENSRALSPTLYSLGHASDDRGRDVEGYAFVHRKDHEARTGSIKPPKGGPTCYSFMASGAKWKTTEPWLVNGLNTRGLSESYVFNNLVTNISKWNSAAQKTVLGNGSLTVNNLVADTQSPDNKNEIYFANVTDSNAIAVTIVWGIFSGPPQGRELVEWDQIYDDNDYDWSSNGETGKMDFENIATHELGHSFGMGDLYDSMCSPVTMYGYANLGETNKRTLETPDINGVKSLYN